MKGIQISLDFHWKCRIYINPYSHDDKNAYFVLTPNKMCLIFFTPWHSAWFLSMYKSVHDFSTVIKGCLNSLNPNERVLNFSTKWKGARFLSPPIKEGLISINTNEKVPDFSTPIKECLNSLKPNERVPDISKPQWEGVISLNRNKRGTDFSHPQWNGAWFLSTPMQGCLVSLNPN